ncbi:helix-turn-helix domain-containing protein [Actinoplanes sp. NBC_00393]|uniref:helix-turn-helix domain-containing protein n=1 Tax=Actinoplanes sp. NBC_00393 TaxID=2975953 RepID=UPI002E1BE978
MEVPSGPIDGSHPVWSTDRMRSAVHDDEAGTVIRLARQAAGWTLGELGARCGYSASTMSRLERGQNPLHLVEVRRRLADVLGIPPQHLGLSPTRVRHTTTGAMAFPGAVAPDKLPEPQTSGDGDSMRRRTLLTGMAVTAAVSVSTPVPAVASNGLEGLLFASALPTAPLKPPAAAPRLADAHRAYAASRYAELGRTLPGLLAQLHATHDAAAGGARDTAAGMLARAYVLASSLCAKDGEDALGWVLADRSLTMARHTGDGLLVASAAHTMAIAMRREGHHAGAVGLLRTTAERLDADGRDATDALIAAYGNLLCTAAYASAQAGRAGDAGTFLDEAASSAGRLRRPADGRVIPFSAATVNIYAIGVYTALGDTPAALDAARQVEAAQLPGPERYGRYCVDTARAWAAHGRPERAVQALLAAERHAPEEVHRPSVRDLVSRLRYAPTSTPEGLRGLAARLGVR